MNRDYPLSPTPNPQVIKGNRGGRVFKTTKERTTSGGLLEPYKYKTVSIDTTGYSKGKQNFKLVTEEGEGDKSGAMKKNSSSKVISRKDIPSTIKKLK